MDRSELEENFSTYKRLARFAIEKHRGTVIGSLAEDIDKLFDRAKEHTINCSIDLFDDVIELAKMSEAIRFLAEIYERHDVTVDELRRGINSALGNVVEYFGENCTRW